MKLLTLILVFLAASCRGPSSADPHRAQDDEALAAELVSMGKAEQDLRFELLAQQGAPARATAERLAIVDEANTHRLIEIVDAQGWPMKSRVGAKAAGAAWLILQHSPDHAFQARMLPEMERLMKSGEVHGQEYALLYDRVEMHAGRPQRYGSQFVTRDGVMRMYEVEDPAHLDQRRASVGLEPIAEYAKELGEMYGAPVEL